MFNKKIDFYKIKNKKLGDKLKFLFMLDENKIDTENENKSEEISEIESLKLQISDLNEQKIRLIAENQNIVRRLKTENEEMLKYAASKFASELIDPIEVLFLALDNVPKNYTETESSHFVNFYQGVDMTKSEFLKVFEKHGIKRIFPLNETFDHNFHQAVSQIQDKTKENNTITEVLKAGYILNGRLIRPAIVVVAINS